MRPKLCKQYKLLQMILYLIDKIESDSLYDHERGKNKFLFYNKKKIKIKQRWVNLVIRKQKLSMQSWTISKTHMCKTKITSWQVSKNNICKKSSNNHFQKALKKIRKKKKIFIKLHCNLINEICAMWVYLTIKSIMVRHGQKSF